MERDKTGTIIVAVDCFRQKDCPKSVVTGDGSCFELVPKKIIVPFELCIKDRVDSLNHQEPLRPCQLGHKRFRTGEIIKKN